MGLKNNRNAYVGMNVETLFKNSVVDHCDVINVLQSEFKIKARFLNANKTGIIGGKSDVRLSFASGHYIDANIKAYKIKTGFNQLTRTSVRNFCKIFKLSTQDKSELCSLIIHKSENAKDKLFPEEIQHKWKIFFENNVKDILKWGFVCSQSREILVLFERDREIFRIYSMRSILNHLKTEIIFTRKGNLNIGDCVSFQRKGGNGSLSKNIPKADISHPGNNVQLKLKINAFVQSMGKYLLSEYKV